MSNEMKKRKKISKTYLVVIAIMTLISCNQIKIDKCLDIGGRWNYETKECEFLDIMSNKKDSLTHDISIKNGKTKAERLSNKFEKAKEKNSTKEINEFIEEFPNSFLEMEELFGFDSNGPAPLYSHETGGQIIKYFSNLEPNNRKSYYNKYIDICINGKWDADNIRDAFGLFLRIKNDMNNICPILMERNDKELTSVFRFMFDGPHPNNEVNKKINNYIQIELPNKYERIKMLSNCAYESLIQEEHGH
jgi:hypothetical protein